VKNDGLPAFYSPDFLVRTASTIFLAETKAQHSRPFTPMCSAS